MAETAQDPTASATTSEPSETLTSEAQLFDELTVLSRDESGRVAQGTEDSSTPPERVDGSGNENVQTDVRSIDASQEEILLDEGLVRDDGSAILDSRRMENLEVPLQETGSSGNQDPVPLVDQPLLEAALEFEQAQESREARPLLPSRKL